MNRRTHHGRKGTFGSRGSFGDWLLAAGEEPPLAAHLVTSRRFYTHHGIYVGHGRVVHYSGFAARPGRGPVEDVSLEQFAGGGDLRLRSRATPRFDRGQVVERARSRLGERRYRLLSNNCEHFAEWCLRGDSRSAQVEAARTLPRRTLEALRRACANVLDLVRSEPLTPSYS